MLRKPAYVIFYLSTLQKPAARAGFFNVLKYKADTFYLSTIQKPSPDQLLFPANTKHLYNICTTSAQRQRQCTNVIQMFRVYWVERSSQRTRGVEPVLAQHCVDVVFAGSVD